MSVRVLTDIHFVGACIDKTMDNKAIKMDTKENEQVYLQIGSRLCRVNAGVSAQAVKKTTAKRIVLEKYDGIEPTFTKLVSVLKNNNDILVAGFHYQVRSSVGFCESCCLALFN